MKSYMVTMCLRPVMKNRILKECYHIYIAVELPWCSIQIDLFIFPSYSFKWGFSVDHYSLNHFRALFSSISLLGLRLPWPLRGFQWWPSSFEQSSRSDVVHIVTEGPYQTETCICFLGLTLLYDVCQTPRVVLLGWSWWPMLVYEYWCLNLC